MAAFYKLLLIISGCAGTLFLSIHLYPIGTFPAGKKLRSLLILLRFSELFLIFLLLFFRFFSFSLDVKVKPNLGILIDRSDSMTLNDAGTKRSDVTNAIISSRTFNHLIRSSNPVFCTFGGDALISKKNTVSLPENLSKSTNMSLAFEKLEQSIAPAKFNAVILLSDGNNNRGPNPVYAAKKIGCPVYAVAIGKDKMLKDLVLTDVRTNEFVYANTRVNVEVEIVARGFNKQKIPVNLFYNNHLSDSKIISMPRNGEHRRILLSYTPKTPGEHLLKASVPALKEEYTDKNNFRELKIKVLKRKIRVLMLSGAPNPDGAVIRRILINDPNVEVISGTFKKKGGFYTDSFSLRNESPFFDVVILNNLFSKKDYYNRKHYIENILKNFNIPFFIVQSSPPVNDFEKVFPCTLYPASGKHLVYVNSLNTFSPIPNVSDLDPSSDLPPVYTVFDRIDYALPVNNIATGILSNSVKKSFPLISALSTGSKKIVFVWAQGFYKWALRTNSSSVFSKLIESSIRWLALRKNLNSGNIVLTTDRTNIQSGQEIGISCQLYDGLYMPASKGVVTLAVEKAGKVFQNKELTNQGNGIFSSFIRFTEPGSYSIYASGSINGNEVGRDTASVFVSHFNAEFQNSAVNLNVLRSIADITNGKLLIPDNSLHSSLKNIFPVSLKKRIRKTIDFLSAPYLLILLLLLPVAEWFLRKRFGLL